MRSADIKSNRHGGSKKMFGLPKREPGFRSVCCSPSINSTEALERKGAILCCFQVPHVSVRPHDAFTRVAFLLVTLHLLPLVNGCGALCSQYRSFMLHVRGSDEAPNSSSLVARPNQRPACANPIGSSLFPGDSDCFSSCA